MNYRFLDADGPDQPSTPAADFVTGSLNWQIERLQCGESLLKANATDAMRRALLRAIAAITVRLPHRTYDLSLWYAVHHTGKGQTIRLLNLRRLE
ncbi:hypothetical protein H3V53_17560 [Paraburkholderia bengalensis]|uniref:Uncharacterized protein n=1 Tax=Paraburkholderia bengalensis TaxID=2747562 RepID=A0ABU8ITX4_9BURK